MSDKPLHVVLCTGQVGLGLAAGLAGHGLDVRAMSRHRPATVADGIDWRATDATDTGAGEGSSVVYQCLKAPYTKGPELGLPLQQGVVRASGGADALTSGNGSGVGDQPPRVLAHLSSHPVRALGMRRGEGRAKWWRRRSADPAAAAT